MSPILIIAVPLLIAFLTVVMKKQALPLLWLTLVFNLVVTLTSDFGIHVIGGFKPPFGISLRLDSYSFMALIVVQGILLFTTFIAKDKIKNDATVVMILLAGINGMLLTNDLFNLFVMIEVVSIAAFILSRLNNKLVDTIHYIVIASVGSVFFLMGTVMVYGLTGSLQIESMFKLLASVSDGKVYIAMLLLIIGLSVELKLMPVGSWAKGIYGNANAFTGALFASVLAPTFAFVFGRLTQEVIVLNDATGYLLMTIAIATLILGELAAYKQVNLRKMLAFSSIAQSGLVVLLFMFNLTFPAILLIINYALAKSILFWIAGKLSESYKTDEGDKLKGVFYHHKLLGMIFSIATLSMMGMPLFFGFLAKVNTVVGAFTVGWIGLPIIIVTIAIVEVAYFMRWLLLLWSPAKEGQLAKDGITIEKSSMFSVNEVIAIVLVALTLFVIGLTPVVVNDYVEDAVLAAGSSQSVLIGEGGAK